LRHLRAAGGVLAAAVLLAGCGGPDRTALAHQTVQTYWRDVGRMKLHNAYMMLTPGNRSALKETDYAQSIIGLLKQTQGLTATLGAAHVNGDSATVPVTLHSPLTRVPQPGCQHLFWTNNRWLISDDSGGLSPASECKT
jgi:hypothetical protein